MVEFFIKTVEKSTVVTKVKAMKIVKSHKRNFRIL